MKTPAGDGNARLDSLIVAVLLGTMALISVVNILGRYIFHYSLAFTEEVTINLFVWMTVVGSGMAFERGGHLGMVTLYRILPRSAQRHLVVVGSGLAAALFLAVDLTLLKAIHAEITLFHARSPALRLPVWIYDAGVVLLSPFVFRGVYRGARRRLDRAEGDAG